MKLENQFLSVLYGGHIRTFYQPIFSLKTGAVLGYEALSRITLPSCEFGIEQLFLAASQMQKLWEFEMLCRTRALQAARQKPMGAKLFLNVDPNVIYDPELRTGFTREKLLEYGLDANDIIFEITEKNDITDLTAFTAAVSHYQSQQFKIAIDDFGSGYSGFNRVCTVSPSYVKLDMALVHCLHTDTSKQALVRGMVQFCRELQIQLIAEGIETAEELTELIRLGVGYGQGFLLGRPSEDFLPCCNSGAQQILDAAQAGSAKAAPAQSSLFVNVASICQKKLTVQPQQAAVGVYEQMQRDESISEVCVLGRDNSVCGVLTREQLYRRFSGQFGYNLYLKRTVGSLMSSDFLAVDSAASLDEVATLAMNRAAPVVYDAVVVTQNGHYAGVVTVRDLLNAAIQMRVRQASEANPLTGLPGNGAVQNTISTSLQAGQPFCVCYIDIDYFKAYNDAYGFANGDRMIRVLAEALLQSFAFADFCGHIGGDDFVVVTRGAISAAQCEALIGLFSENILPLYNPEDRERGSILSKNRQGVPELFPLATLSVAVLSIGQQQYADLAELSVAVAHAKKQSKQQAGHSVVVV